MSEERLKILQMLAEGKITAADADRLLARLAGESERASPGSDEPRRRPRFLRIVVDGPDRETVDARVPLGFLRAGLKLGTVLPSRVRERLAARGIDIASISPTETERVMQGLDELDLQVEDGEKGHVRIFCE